MGKLYVPTGLSAGQIDVVVVFHGTVSSGTIASAAEGSLNHFLNPNTLNLRDKIIFSAAYPQDHISSSDQYNLPGVGTETSTFLMGDNLAYTRAAVGWVKDSLNGYIAGQGGSKTIGDVYLFGHSQGGKLVAKMNTLETGIAGVVANAPGPIQFDQTCSAQQVKHLVQRLPQFMVLLVVVVQRMYILVSSPPFSGLISLTKLR